MRALLLSLVIAFVISSAGCSDVFEPEPERDPTCTYYKNGDADCPLY